MKYRLLELMPRAAHIVFAMAVPVACGTCGGEPRVNVAPMAAAAPSTVTERMLAMLPQGAQVVVELDLARLRANPVVGEVVTRALAERTADRPAGVPASPLAVADQVVLAAYGVGTAQAATLTLLAARHDIAETERSPEHRAKPEAPDQRSEGSAEFDERGGRMKYGLLAGATRVADGVYAVGPPEWVGEVQQRVALATTGEAAFAIRAAPELLELRRHAMPANAPGASLRLTARLSFDARIALARQTGLDAAPAQLSAWGDVADDLVLIVDCDAADPGNRPAGRRGSDAPRRLSAALRGVLAAVSDQPIVRALGLPSSLAGAKLAAQGSWVRTIIAIGPAHLRRVVQRAAALLREAAPAPPTQSPAPAPPPAAPNQPPARGGHAS
jgi:hypothetical protein